MAQTMSLAESAPLQGSQDRRNRILDAAERCFARTGFHKATMQDVAAECGMSPGNLYRYFASKDDIVAGMAERDRERFMHDVERLKTAPDPRATFEMLGRQHLVDEPREKALLMTELWAEGARNPRIGTICSGMDEIVREILTEFVRHWRRVEGIEGAPMPPEDVATLMLLLGDGIYRQRAASPHFDAGAAFALIFPILLDAVGVRRDPVREVA
jgi:TetR/AcrR family transcriptional regulator, repressor for uid operon